MHEMPINEAAAALGVHPATVRRRIESGTLAAHQDERGRYLVSLSAAQALIRGKDSTILSAEAARDEIEEQRVEMARLQAERDALAVKVERLGANYERALAEAEAARERMDAARERDQRLIAELVALVRDLNGGRPAPPE